VLNVDGSDWRRKKWGKFARTYIKLSEWFSIHLPDATVTDSRVMQQYYRQRFGVETECIYYGADMPPPTKPGILKQLGIDPRGYLLLVGRLVPENCIHHLVDAFERLDTNFRCVIVGDAPYQKEYIADLRRRGPHVLFTGYLFGDSYRELMQNAYAVVLCTEVGGTHPVLVEAMSAGNCVVVNDTPANLEVIGDAGIMYQGSLGADGLLPVLQSLLQDEPRVERYRGLARAHLQDGYSWNTITSQYELLFARLTSVKMPLEPAIGETRGRLG
jgi:glycosyltransferase involved in cell wall biosynthesis